MLRKGCLSTLSPKASFPTVASALNTARMQKHSVQITVTAPTCMTDPVLMDLRLSIVLGC